MPALVSRASAGDSSQRSGRAELPPYVAPEFPLTSKGQQELSLLLTRYPTKNLEEHLQNALDTLSENVAAINDDHMHSIADHEKRKRKLRKLEEDGDASEEARQSVRETVMKGKRDLAEQKKEVDGMTASMEEQVRKMIDAQASLQFTQETIRDLSRNVRTSSNRRANSSPDPSTPATRPTSTFDPTDPANDETTSTLRPTSLLPTFRDTLTRKRDAYALLPPRTRYATNNDYRNFKRILHDALHQDDSAPQPHEDTWFPSQPAATPGQTGTQRATGAGPGDEAAAAAAAAADDDDGNESDDLAVAREKVSTRCPLTLREFEDPVTSSKCPHSFEREAIGDMLRRSEWRVELDPAAAAAADDPGALLLDARMAAEVEARGRGVERAVRCPVPGCRQVLCGADLRTDKVLVRRIRRLQRAAAAREDGDDDEEVGEGGARKVVEVESGDEEDGKEEEEGWGRVEGVRSRSGRVIKGES